MNDGKIRCSWACKSELEARYHDLEWGTPTFNDLKLFEFINLEGAQAGVSWLVVLQKRENYRLLFDGFDPEKMANYGEDKIASLLVDPRIIRNKLKINSMVTNAQAYLDLVNKGVSFSDYLWQFVDGKPIVNKWENRQDVPTKTTISDALSKDLKKKGFKFIGTTICYAFMQAVGMVNDHTTDCWRYQTLVK